jgi:DNA polymerase-3 subunit delta'
MIGHKTQWDFLVKAAKLNRLSHAYLFYGQEQIGKRKLAVEFVKFLNCSSGDFSKRPCQVCRNCQDIQKGAYPDLISIEPEDSQKGIQISQIRNLIWKISLKPYGAAFKVAILDKAHLMTKDSQNCFLKILEEPKGKALLILITEYSEILLPTILSRVQKLRFSPVKSAEIENYLKKEGLSPEKAEYFSRFSLGKPGVAINFLSNPQQLEDQKKIISELIKISNSDLPFRFQYAKKLSEESFNFSENKLKEYLDTWLGYFRDIFLSRLRFAKQGWNSEVGDNILNHYSLSKIRKIIKLLQSTKLLISTTNINPKLAFEILLMEV